MAGGRGVGKKKIEIKKIEEQDKKYVTFSKRRKGLFKKIEELGIITGCQAAALVFSPALKKPHTAATGDMSLIDRYLIDTSIAVAPRHESEIEKALKLQAGKKIEEINDLNELMEMKSELEKLRESLKKQINM